MAKYKTVSKMASWGMKTAAQVKTNKKATSAGMGSNLMGSAYSMGKGKR